MVIREFLSRAIDDSTPVKVIYFETTIWNSPIKNENLYHRKKAFIHANYKAISWDSVYKKIMNLLHETRK